MRKHLLFIVLLCLPLLARAEYMEDRLWHPNEIRVGYGDPLFETMVWHDSPRLDYGEETHNYRFSGHIVAEYQHRCNTWFGYGLQFDYQQVWWDHWTRPDGKTVVIEKDRSFYDISLIPTIRFTFLHTEWVNMYCGLGAGLLINGGTEKDMYGRQVACAPVINFNWLGISVGRDMFFGALELGSMVSLTNSNNIYMLGSRLLTATVGVRF